MSKGKNLAYVRVSSLDQNEARQMEALIDFKIDKFFVDKFSGKNMNRVKLLELLDYARDGDVIFIHSLDRLARNLEDLLKIVKKLTDEGVEIKFVKENLVFNGEDSSVNKLMLSIMGAFAEFERNIIRERQKEGIEIAKRDGKYKGGQLKFDSETVQKIKEKYEAGISISKIARDHKVQRPTIYRYLKK